MDQRFIVGGVDASTPLNQAAPAILRSKAEPLFELEASAAGGADMDAVHDMRVASRRLREAMRLLEPLYPQAAYREWFKRVRRVTGALGPVRDSDVFIDAFSRFNRELEPGGTRAVAFLVGYRMGQRERELVLLNRVMAKLDLRETRRSLDKIARAPRRGDEAGRPLAAFAHASVAERIATVYSMLPAALDEANIETQHALRIAFKRLRYAVEVFAPCYADRFDQVHGTLTAFQDSLGDLHDLHIFLDMLREPGRVASALRAGVSADDLAQVEGLLERKAHGAFKRFSTLAEQHPAGELMPALLLPLSRPAEHPAAPPVDPAEASLAVAVAGVVEPAPPEIAIADFGGSAIDPPIVIGAQPWAAGAATPVAPSGTQVEVASGSHVEPLPELPPVEPVQVAR